ncbi:MAG: alpha-L-fucosidase [Capsulimonas sp.]|uniref:alpha-L-fucosidase n=1 Tax=Capsulimonas sp. TaxID=2494211 RepID=UPI003263EE11
MKHLWNAALAGLLLAGAVLARPSHAQGPSPTAAHMQWWRDARFGMFIHWGPVSLKGTEISISRSPNPYGPNEGGIPAAEYDNLYKQFNPTKFDPKAIVALAKAAGMKYIVFTAKHHDGFAEWDSKLTDYKITSPLSPYQKDIVKQLADATRAAGLHWCVYYSQPDLHHPDYDVNQPAYDKYFHAQVHELLTNYGKVDLIWFDGLGASADYWDAQNLFKEMRATNPNLIINDRCGLPGDYNSPEQRVGAYDDQHPWETCMTIGDQWAYKPDDSYKSATRCIQTLAKCAGGDGNLLLNIGPQPDGQVDPTQADRLRAIAAWMKTRGVSITGTRGGPYKPTSSYVSTRKGNTVYVHVLGWTGDSVTLPVMPKAITGSRVLGGGSVQVRQTPEGVTITVPTGNHDASDTVIALQLNGSAMDLAPIAATISGPPATLAATNVYHQIPTYDAAMAYDGDDGTRWATDDGVKQAAITAEFAKPAVIQGVSIHEAIEKRVQKFELQYQAPGGSDWITLAAGTQIGEHYTASFTPVQAKSFRLNILDSTEGPTISEISFMTAK